MFWSWRRRWPVARLEQNGGAGLNRRGWGCRNCIKYYRLTCNVRWRWRWWNLQSWKSICTSWSWWSRRIWRGRSWGSNSSSLSLSVLNQPGTAETSNKTLEAGDGTAYGYNIRNDVTPAANIPYGYSGGSGVVVFRAPSDAKFNVSPGSNTITTAPGGEKIATFNVTGTLTI